MNRTVLFKRLFSTKLTNVKDVKPLLKSQLNTGKKKQKTKETKKKKEKIITLCHKKVSIRI
jgi:hypothetical protein